MANFLNRLAARALGAAPLAEPVIPTRFSSGAEQSAFLPSEPAFQPTRLFPQTYPETFEDRPHPTPIREAALNSETRIDRPASPFQDLAGPPHPRLSPRPRAFPPPPFAEPETAQPSPERVEVWKPNLAEATEPPQYANEKPAAHRPQAISPAPVLFAEPLLAPQLTPLVEPARSPTLQRPEVPSALRPAPPTVRVSIGRIEVRAEITSPVPKAPAQRPRPSTLSLDQFLKQAGRGAR